MLYLTILLLRTEKVIREECTFAFEKECLPLDKQKCKNFPEQFCPIVNVTKIQNKCHSGEEEQVSVMGQHIVRIDLTFPVSSACR